MDQHMENYIVRNYKVYILTLSNTYYEQSGLERFGLYWRERYKSRQYPFWVIVTHVKKVGLTCY